MIYSDQTNARLDRIVGSSRAFSSEMIAFSKYEAIYNATPL
jgi:hypothetical protein